MKYYFSIILIALLFSCQEKVESKLDFERLGVSEENRYTNLDDKKIFPKISVPSRLKQNEKHYPNLSFWDKHNLKQLQTISVPDDSIINLTSNDFEFSYYLDSCYYLGGNLAKSNLLLKGEIKNKKEFKIFFQSASCNGVAYKLKFKKNASSTPLFHCNISVPTIEIIESKEVYHFETVISVLGKNKRIKPSFILQLISAENVNIQKITPIKEIKLTSNEQIIPKKLEYIFSN